MMMDGDGNDGDDHFDKDGGVMMGTQVTWRGLVLCFELIGTQQVTDPRLDNNLGTAIMELEIPVVGSLCSSV